MSNNVSDSAKRIWVPAALQNYDAASVAMKNEIMQNQGIDNVSKKELLDQLAAGRETINNTSTSNMYTYGDVQNSILSSIAGKEKTAAGNDPFYVTRRLVQDQQQAIEETPGRLQTILTSGNSTSNPTPTLLTGGI